ncbi:MAG: glycosyltransferase family 39 protein [Propionivibrio sp.]
MAALKSFGFGRAPWFWLLALVAFRLSFSVILPMTGDEAYFVLWGEHPAGGYYDHPPMVGWWLSGLLSVSRAEWFLRLPVFLLPLFLAASAWWMVRPHGAERARVAAVLVLLQPANVWNVLITTDTPVILFSMFSLLAYVAALRAVEQSRPALAWHALAGLLLGLAFLGKYFAALLGIAYLGHVLFVRRDRGRWSAFAVLVLAALPAPIQNLWWNSGHCWVNVLFNFMNRNAESGLSWTNPALYAASLAYLATPWVLFALLRERGGVRQAMRASPASGAVFWLMAIPLGLFGLMSLWRSIGLHWLVSFVPLLAVLAAIALRRDTLQRLVCWSAVFAAAHALVIVVVSVSPMQRWRDNKLYDGIVMTVRADEVIERLAPYAKDYLFATESYSSSATLAYNANRPFAVFGGGSFHARQDDFLTDWRAQDGRNVLILLKGKDAPAAADYAAYFARVDLRQFELHGARFHLVLGQGFKYAVYHDAVLKRIRDRYYRIPAWLPQRGCEFCERYFPTGQ